MAPKKLEEMLGFMERRVEKRGGKIKEFVTPYFYFVEYPNSKILSIILLFDQLPLRILTPLYEQAKKEVSEVYPIFYKDGKTYFRRVVDYNSALREFKSLKVYDLRDINRMVTLTAQERFSLTDFNKESFEMKIKSAKIAQNYFPTRMLYYYQPKTERLKEDLRFFRPYPVIFDYSHIRENDPKYPFVKNNVSKTYFIPKEVIFKDLNK